MQVTDYIKSEHPYTRKIDADYGRVYQALKTVLAAHDFEITKEEDPSTYERNEYSERVNKEKSTLIFTDIKKPSAVVDLASVHLNVYLYQVGDWTDIDMRFEGVKLRIKKFFVYRDDKLINQLLDEIEKEIGG